VSGVARFDGEPDGATEAFAGGVLTLVLPRAYAPGAPMRFTVEGPGGPVALTGKTMGSRRRDDGRFTVRVRLTNLRRAERDALEAMHP
jgi:hypothetical protein